MFTPFKNLITYIQKNANFGSNSSTAAASAIEENVKMEASDKLKTQTVPTNTESVLSEEDEIPAKPGDKKEQQLQSPRDTNKNQPTHKDPPTAKPKTSSLSAAIPTTVPLRTSPRKNVTSLAISATPTSITTAPTSCESEEDDIESQIESSIMLKKPVKDGSHKGSEILEVKKSPDRSVVISHDYNRNQAVTPIDDELEDFRHDPTEVVTSTSPPNNTTDLEQAEADKCSTIVTCDEKEVGCETTVAAESNNHLKSDEEKQLKHDEFTEEYEVGGDKDKTVDTIVISDQSGSDRLDDSTSQIILAVDSDMDEELDTLSSISIEEDDIAEVDLEEEEEFLEMSTFPGK